MSLWRPSLSEFVAPFANVRAWEFSLERHRKGIDNAHIDVYLSPRLRNEIRKSVRKLIIIDSKRGRSGAVSHERIRTEDLKSFRESYLDIFESLSKQANAGRSADRLALLQIALLKYSIQIVAREKASLHQALKVAANQEEARASGRNLSMHEHLVALTRDDQSINHRMLRFLFRQIKTIEGTHLEKVRESLVGLAWPFPRRAFFNPVLMFPNPTEVEELARAYPIARLGEDGDTDWLFQTNQCISTVFQHYLPRWTRLPSNRGLANAGSNGSARERRDQGQLPGFLGTEILLSRFVPGEEYQSGRCSWLDEPENLRLFLTSGRQTADASTGVADPGLGDLSDSELGFAHDTGVDSFDFSGVFDLSANPGANWPQPGWKDFQNAVADELYRCLDLQGLSQRIVLLSWLRSVRHQLGRPVPLSLVSNFVEGHLGRRRLAQRLDSLHLALDPASVSRTLERTAVRLRQLGRFEQERYLRAYLIDFLILRRDLKVAYKTYEAMDRIRLLEDPHQVQLSRANASLYEFPGSSEGRPRSKRQIRSHAVLKADVRGSTSITEGLRTKGLNPASHFSLNFFGPVNKLLSDFGGEKVFVEGDAVIIAMYEHEAEPAAMAVSRACGLARNMIRVVSLQNVINRKHGLPELELGVGISYSDREPNFLYDEGHRIMISEAINRADRLSSCAAALRRGGFRPEIEGFRVEVVRNANLGANATQSEELLRYNVNGIKLEKAAFFKLQKEMNLRHVHLPEMETGNDLLFTGSFPDLAGREHWLVVRYALIREWDGRALGPLAANSGHFFEVIADEALSARVRKLVLGGEGLPLRGRG